MYEDNEVKHKIVDTTRLGLDNYSIARFSGASTPGDED